MDNNFKTALITGATKGIGYELAKLFAKDNYHLVIVGRHGPTLTQVSRELEKLGAQGVTIIIEDLMIPGVAKNIFNRVLEEGLVIDVLVNDAGAGVYGDFNETELEKELDVIQLNVVLLTELTKYYLKQMLFRNEGKILQLASAVSYQPTPRLAVYAATKAFVLSLTDTLIEETKDSNVIITALIPAATPSDFYRKAGIEYLANQEISEDPAVVAKVGYEALMKGQAHDLAPSVRSMIVKNSFSLNDNLAKNTAKYLEEKN